MPDVMKIKPIALVAAWTGSAVCAGTAALLAPQSMLPVLVAVAAAATLWTLTVLLSGRPAVETPDEAHRVRAEPDAAHQRVVGSSDSVHDQCSRMNEELTRVQQLLHEAITGLTQSFHNMHGETTSQRETAMALTGGDGSQQFDFARFVDETSGTMQRVVDSVVHNSKLGMELVELTEGIARETESVRALLGEIGGISKQTNLLTTMQGITDSSRRIADIIGVIDGIAFQTNILALNAAVEAARAGEQGRGFAVVADEVRDLSARTSDFSQQIVTLVDRVQANVKMTESALANMAGQDMTFALESKTRVETVVRGLEMLHQRRQQSIVDLGASVERVDQAVAHAVTSLQFQDMTAQLIGHVQKRIGAIDGVCASVRELSRAAALGNASPELAQRVDDALAHLAVVDSTNPVAQKAYQEGEIELF